MLRPNIIITTTLPPGRILIGSNITYNVTLTNVRPATANNLTVTGELPPCLVFVFSKGETAHNLVEHAGMRSHVQVRHVPTGTPVLVCQQKINGLTYGTNGHDACLDMH